MLFVAMQKVIFFFAHCKTKRPKVLLQNLLSSIGCSGNLDGLSPKRKNSKSMFQI